MATFNNPSRITVEGYLSTLAEKVFSGEGLKHAEKLTTSQLERIATIYGHLARDHDLYNLLFEAEPQLLEVDGTTIHTQDLMMFAFMDWQRQRGWFWKPTGTAPTDSGVCNGVPLAFLGARRVFDKTYMSWLGEDYTKCDIFLPFGLNSYMLSEEGKIVPNNDSSGLIAFHVAHKKDALNYSFTHIARLREEVPRFRVTAKPKKVDANNIDENDRYGKFYNRAAPLMRCMILQGWCWTGPSRCDNMITDFRDWDNFEGSADTPGNAYKGQLPKDTTIPNNILKFTGIKREEHIEQKNKFDADKLDQDLPCQPIKTEDDWLKL